jgi:hypothetical protein
MMPRKRQGHKEESPIAGNLIFSGFLLIRTINNDENERELENITVLASI